MHTPTHTCAPRLKSQVPKLSLERTFMAGFYVPPNRGLQWKHWQVINYNSIHQGMLSPFCVCQQDFQAQSLVVAHESCPNVQGELEGKGTAQRKRLGTCRVFRCGIFYSVMFGCSHDHRHLSMENMLPRQEAEVAISHPPHTANFSLPPLWLLLI